MKKTHKDQLESLGAKIAQKLRDGSWELGWEFSNPAVLDDFIHNEALAAACREQWPEGDSEQALKAMANEGGSLAALFQQRRRSRKVAWRKS